MCVCLLVYEWLGNLLIVFACVCVCVVSSRMCVPMMSVVSVSTSEGGVIADVLPLSPCWLCFPKQWGFREKRLTSAEG